MAEQETAVIVVADVVAAIPELNGVKYTVHHYNSSTPAELVERVKDANIICTYATHIPREAIDAAPRLRLISTNKSGTDHIDKTTAAERGVSVSHVPAQNTVSVTEHALAMFFALRRRLLPLHQVTMQGQGWTEHGAPNAAVGFPPRTNSEETAVIFGYGAIGKNIARLTAALEMRVLIAERKGVDPSACRPGRTPFVAALQQGTAFFNLVPLDDDTKNMLGEAEFALMSPRAYVINVARGALIDEQALVNALRERRLAGAATDVFVEEPATSANSVLLDPTIPNLILTPHIAWYGQATLDGTRNTYKANLEGFLKGQPQNLVVGDEVH